jgi:predicted dienelactone hydrolase
MRELLSARVPVYENASVGLKKLQPIFFSHGMTCHRLSYTGLCMELASCGYCVVTLTHGDGSADYHPQAGFFEEGMNINDYRARNTAVKLREKEILSLVKEFTSHNFLQNFGLDWKFVELSKNVVLMGHSYGGITALGAA